MNLHMKTLFDENGLLNIDEIVANHPSYKAIMEDGIVTDQELRDQAEATIVSLRHLEEICSAEHQAAIVDAIAQLSVLYAAYHNYQLQDFRK